MVAYRRSRLSRTRRAVDIHRRSVASGNLLDTGPAHGGIEHGGVWIFVGGLVASGRGSAPHRRPGEENQLRRLAKRIPTAARGLPLHAALHLGGPARPGDDCGRVARGDDDHVGVVSRGAQRLECPGARDVLAYPSLVLAKDGERETGTWPHSCKYTLPEAVNRFIRAPRSTDELVEMVAANAAFVHNRWTLVRLYSVT